MKKQHAMKAFTLVEMLLVLVIVSSLIYMLFGYVQQKAMQMRIDRASLQMQQVLNAGLSYYVGNGVWPVPVGTAYDLTANPNAATNLLQFNGYLPNNVAIASPFAGGHYFIYTDAMGKMLYVYTAITSASGALGLAAAESNIIAGALPLAYTSKTNGTPPPTGAPCTAADTTCYVVASINIPGQNLNSTGSITFAGVYKQGGCVPVPTCPVNPATGLPGTPQVYIVPVSVSGMNDQGSMNIYPISSFTGYATGPAANPAACSTYTSQTPSCASNIVGSPTSTYWRACLQVVTEKGNVQLTNNYTGNAAIDWGNQVTLMAITRCSIPNESAGSSFSVYGD